jgi:cytochrome c oxidase subunit I+III
MDEIRQPVSPIRLHKQLDAVWGTKRGLPQLAAVNHTIVGKRFIVTAFVFFGIGGVLAMLIRAQIATSNSLFTGPEIYNQLFTMHGTVMMFLFAIPLIEGLAFYMLPKMLGARDMAFPRLSAFGYWCYLSGGSILLVAMAIGLAPDSGWFMYTPLSSRPFTPGINSDIWLIGITFVEVSAIAAAVEIVVTIFKVRAPGMSLDRMPLFAWYILVTAFMMLFGFPPLIIGSVLLEIERAFDFPFFDPNRGGDPLLWQHLFWLFGHPEVYIIFLPAAGVVSTVLPVLARREIIGYMWIVVSIVALGFLSFGLWVHHMFATGIPHLALAFFSAASTAVVIPTVVQIFAWVGTLLAGRPQLKIPMLFILGFFFIFIIGGLTGIMVAIVPFNWQVHDTHFVVAHLHYVLVGGFVFPMMAAAYYWLPHVTGRVPRISLGGAVFWLVFIGFNLTFFVMHLTGLLGMPRRIYTYSADAGWDWLNLISSIGGFVMAIGFVLFTVDVVLQLAHGRRTPRNPWNAGTLEWAMAKPPTPYNFASIPEVHGREPLADRPALACELARGEGYLGFQRDDRMETLAVEITSGRLEQVVRLPRQSYLPLFTAITTGMFFVGVLVQLYIVAIVGFFATIALALLWTRDSGATVDQGSVSIGREQRAPFHFETTGSPPAWGMTMTLGADAAAFASLAFGLVFLWVIAPNWPPPEALGPSPWLAGLTGAGLIGAAIAAWRSVSASVLARQARRETWLALAGVAQTAALAGLVVMILAVPAPTHHAYNATTFVVLAYVALHAGVGALLAFYGIWRSRRGYVSAVRSLDLTIAAQWHFYTALTGILALLLVLGVSWVLPS